MQDSHSTKIHMDLNNLHSNLWPWENVSSFHPNNQDEIRKAYLQGDSCQPLGHVYLKKKLVEHCVYLTLISLKNTKISWKISLKMKIHFVYTVTYWGKLLVLVWRIQKLVGKYH